MRRARDAIFRERARTYYAVIAGFGVVFLILGLLLHEPALGHLAALKIGVIVAAMAACRLAKTSAPVGILQLASVALFAGLFAAMAWTGIALGDAQTPSLLIGGTIVGAAGVFPWGVGVQTLVAAVGTAAWGVMISLAGGVSPFAAAVFLSFAGSSPLLTWSLHKQWRAQWRHQDEASSRARRESAIARTLAAAGRDLFEHLGQTDLMTQACRIMHEALSADFVVTLVTADDGTSLDAASQYGLDDPVWATYGVVRVPSAIASVIRERLEPTGLYLLDVDEAGLSGEHAERREIARRIGLGPILLLALRSEGTIAGVVAACRRQSSATFGEDDMRTAQDLAPLVSASLENHRLLRALEAANRVQHELLAGMSHELRTPLNVILGYLEMLLDGAAGPLSEPQRDLCRRVRESAAQQLALVGETLEISRRDAAGQVTLRREEVNLEALFSELAADLRVGQPRDEIDVSWRVQPGMPRVATDPIKLRMVLRNLAENAVRHTPAGEVTVHARLDGPDLVIEVRDTGVGIPASERERVFEAFRQGSAAPAKGLGLGLHIVRRLVEAMAGEVALESREGQGSCFTVRIPVSAVSAASA